MYRILRENANTSPKFKNCAVYMQCLIQELRVVYLWEHEGISVLSLKLHTNLKHI